MIANPRIDTAWPARPIAAVNLSLELYTLTLQPSITSKTSNRSAHYTSKTLTNCQNTEMRGVYDTSNYSRCRSRVLRSLCELATFQSKVEQLEAA